MMERMTTMPERRSPIDGTLFGLVLAAALLSDILGFNQLTTQSPTDAIVQVIVFSVGGAGAIEAVRRIVFGRSSVERVLAIPFALLSISGFAAWCAPWSTGAMAMITAVSGLFIAGLGAATIRRNRRVTDPGAAQIISLVAMAQGLLLIYFAALAIGDINGPIFG